MTLHLVQGLTTTGRRRGRHKHRSAEAAQQSRQQAADWAALKERWGVEEVERKRNVALRAPAMKSYSLSYPPGREPKQHIPSVDTGVQMAARPEDKVYTGTSMLGVVVQHKSCLQPVFSVEEARESASMRR